MIDENRKINSKEWDGQSRWLYPVDCKICNKEFFAPKKEILKGNAKYCSIICRGRGRRTGVLLKCAWCNKDVIKKPSALRLSKSGLYFCNRECKERAQVLGGLKEIQPTHYGTATLETLSNESYRPKALRWISKSCQTCGYHTFEKMLDVHHKDGNRINNNMENLEVLCVWCHALKTRNIEWHKNNGDLVHSGRTAALQVAEDGS